MGLLRFAQLLTQCCIKYLGCDTKEWVGDCDDNLIDDIIVDILNGGNFGQKDVNRYNQIKYISDRESNAVSKRNPIAQLFFSINAKTKNDFHFINKFKILLPIGWLCTIFKYLYMVIIGKRSIDSMITIREANKRKSIYDEFLLFKK